MADILDARVYARRQKDLDGYVERYQDILDRRQVKYAQEIRPIWERTAQRLDVLIKKLYKEYSDGQGKLSPEKLQTKKYEISRLAMLRREVAALLTDAEDPLQKKLHRNLAYQYAHSYYFTAFGMEQAAQVDVRIPLLTENYVMGVLANPWLPDGATYSDRLRANTVYLAEKMYNSVGRAMVEGWSVNETARHIQRTAQEGYYNAVRLARTELTRAASQGATQAMLQNADILDGKRWNAALDSRTAPKDARNDGKLYPLEYDTPEMPGVPGERIPNHPNCRCKYSPVLSALGVNKRERIARGEGDNTENFGERTYTKARTYKEYAKERGLPDLDERLANDDPRRYLRRGEKLDDYRDGLIGQKPVDPQLPPTPEPVKTITAATAWADQVKQRIAQGVTTEAQAREVGGLVRREIENRVGGEIASAKEQLAVLVEKCKVLQAEKDAAREALNNVRFMSPEYREAFDKFKELRDKIDEKLRPLYEERGKLSTKLASLRGDATRDIIAEIRPMGSSREANIIGRPRKETKQALEEARGYIPTAWLELSDTTSAMAVKKANRGYYSHYGTPEIVTSGSSIESMRETFLHEMGHRMEYIHPTIKKLEKEFYERRTAGEALQWLGSGYGRDERTRKDNFVSAYMGKDYGGRAYELLSMGIQSAFLSIGRYDLTKDEDYYDFILGVITAL